MIQSNLLRKVIKRLLLGNHINVQGKIERNYSNVDKDDDFKIYHIILLKLIIIN